MTCLAVLRCTFDTDKNNPAAPHEIQTPAAFGGLATESRRPTNCKQTLELTGFLMHICVGGGAHRECFRPEVSCARQHAHFLGSQSFVESDWSRSLVHLGSEFHDDYELWQWAVKAGINARGRGCQCPCIVWWQARLTYRTINSDASTHAVRRLWLTRAHIGGMTCSLGTKTMCCCEVTTRQWFIRFIVAGGGKEPRSRVSYI